MRADEDQLAFSGSDPAGEAEVFREEAVAGVNGRGAGVVGDGQDFVGVVIGGHLIEGFSPPSSLAMRT